jgi:2-C-methyl-D-erythritol 4-phosphate cytidylyltransferase
MRFHALIPAAGGGTRFLAPVPKQYALLHGKPVLLHAIERLSTHFPLASLHLLLAPADHLYDHAVGPQAHVTPLRCGGATRAETVRHGLEALAAIARDEDWVVVHDAVRPCIEGASLERLRAELADDPVGGLLAVPMASSLKRADTGQRVLRSESRDGLWHAQTPQMFRFAVLRAAFTQPDVDHVTDEAQAVEALGVRPRLVLGSRTNVKITYPDDLDLAAAIVSLQQQAAEVAL